MSDALRVKVLKAYVIVIRVEFAVGRLRFNC